MIRHLSFNDIQVRNIIFQHIIIIIVGIGIFWLEEIGIASLFWEKLILLILALGKCIYFIEHSFRKIEEASLNDISYNKFLGIILTNVMLIVISFAVDYSCLQQIDGSSFRGISQSPNFIDKAFDFFYFSLVSFTTVAYGDIIPVTKSAKVLSILEVTVAYVTTIIVISNFVQIKDSLGKRS
jgi:Ion channel